MKKDIILCINPDTGEVMENPFEGEPLDGIFRKFHDTKGNFGPCFIEGESSLFVFGRSVPEGDIYCSVGDWDLVEENKNRS